MYYTIASMLSFAFDIWYWIKFYVWCECCAIETWWFAIWYGFLESDMRAFRLPFEWKSIEQYYINQFNQLWAVCTTHSTSTVECIETLISNWIGQWFFQLNDNHFCTSILWTIVKMQYKKLTIEIVFVEFIIDSCKFLNLPFVSISSFSSRIQPP